jgi:hypothetical protein
MRQSGEAAIQRLLMAHSTPFTPASSTVRLPAFWPSFFLAFHVIAVGRFWGFLPSGRKDLAHSVESHGTLTI